MAGQKAVLRKTQWVLSLPQALPSPPGKNNFPRRAQRGWQTREGRAVLGRNGCSPQGLLRRQGQTSVSPEHCCCLCSDPRPLGSFLLFRFSSQAFRGSPISSLTYCVGHLHTALLSRIPQHRPYRPFPRGPSGAVPSCSQ